MAHGDLRLAWVRPLNMGCIGVPFCTHTSVYAHKAHICMHAQVRTHGGVHVCEMQLGLSVRLLDGLFSYAPPLKSKEEVVFVCGFRRQGLLHFFLH